MRLGLFGARADLGGLAAQTWELWRHLEPERTLVVDLGRAGRGPADPTRYPGAMLQEGMDHLILPETVDAFLDGLDVVVGVETFYVDSFCRRARERGVRTILIANPELVRADHDPPDVVWLPTPWEAERLPQARVVPHPVARDRLPFRPRTECRTFLHVAAPAFHDRNGTRLLLAALRHVTAPCRLILHGKRLRPPKRVGRVEIEARDASCHDYWDAYPNDAHALVLPRRYGGQSLPMNEAASLGLPIVSLDLPPQNAWLAPECLVAARPRRHVAMVGGTFTVHDADPRSLAAVMTALVRDSALVERCSKESDRYADSISWERWRPRYRDLLADVTAG